MAVANPVAGSFTAAAQVSSELKPKVGGPRGRRAYFNYSLSGTFVGTVVVERSFDGGTTFHVFRSDTAPVEAQLFESEESVLWRCRCSVYTSGTAVYRLSL